MSFLGPEKEREDSLSFEGLFLWSLSPNDTVANAPKVEKELLVERVLRFLEQHGYVAA
ncbi:MAG TPA: hypothetical protein VFA02_11115 [Pseudacidobacterium sp.]|nr:hypothetical protein [Pseudacidobacterium sp.]